MRKIYKDFAYIYDKLMYDVDYNNWAQYIETIIKNNNVNPEIVVDLGCGTGNFCVEMSKRGYDMIGIDLSSEMLSCAKDKAEKEELDILFLNQDMTEFELYGTVDVAVCLMDSINYITSKNKLKRLFKLIKNYLNPNGIFIFDINTCYKMGKILGNEVFYDISDDITYIWENSFDKRANICRFDLTFFVNNSGKYDKYEEIHLERGYSTKELKEIIKNSGLELLDIFDELSFKKPNAKSERIFFVCRKPEQI